MPEALAAGVGQRQRCVRAARDRLQPDPAGQHPLGAAFSAGVARHGGGMSPRCPEVWPKAPNRAPRQGKRTEIEPSAGM